MVTAFILHLRDMPHNISGQKRRTYHSAAMKRLSYSRPIIIILICISFLILNALSSPLLNTASSLSRMRGGTSLPQQTAHENSNSSVFSKRRVRRRKRRRRSKSNHLMDFSEPSSSILEPSRKPEEMEAVVSLSSPLTGATSNGKQLNKTNDPLSNETKPLKKIKKAKRDVRSSRNRQPPSPHIESNYNLKSSDFDAVANSSCVSERNASDLVALTSIEDHQQEFETLKDETENDDERMFDKPTTTLNGEEHVLSSTRTFSSSTILISNENSSSNAETIFDPVARTVEKMTKVVVESSHETSKIDEYVSLVNNMSANNSHTEVEAQNISFHKNTRIFHRSSYSKEEEGDMLSVDAQFCNVNSIITRKETYEYEPTMLNDQYQTSTTYENMQETSSNKIIEGAKKVTFDTTIKKKAKKSSVSQNVKVKQTSYKKLASPSLSAIGGGRDGECLRRIKREWRDAVKLGIGYDWIKMKTVTVRGRSPSGRNIVSDRTKSKSRIVSQNMENETESNDCQEDNDEIMNFLKYNYVRIGPFGKNLLSWHFSVMGPTNSIYEGGVYHGRVLLPKDYPGSPPRVQMLTPSGRFVPGEDICLSASSYHPETWTPRWTVLSLVEALRLHMLTTSNEIGGLNASRETRIKLAGASRSWRLGSIDHGHMIRNGLFSTLSCSSSREAANDVVKVRGKDLETDDFHSSTRDKFSFEHESDGAMDNDGVHDGQLDSDYMGKGNNMANSKTAIITKTRGIDRRREHQQERLAVVFFRALVEVLKSPLKLALFIFLSIFVFLNSK